MCDHEGSKEDQNTCLQNDIDSGERQQQQQNHSYYKLLRDNRKFRLYTASYLVAKCGEWFTYVAVLSMIEEWGHSRTAISALVVLHLLPNVVLSAAGGALADSYDRRHCMILLDMIGAGVTLLHLIALYYQSIPMIYVVTILKETVAGLLEPCRGALLPLLVTNQEDLKLGTTLAVLSWSLMAAVGSSVGGFVVAFLGYRVSFLLESFTYLWSAYLMYLVGGSWKAAPDETIEYTSIWDQLVTMTVEGYAYVRKVPWGPIVLIKATAGFIYGASDVLNVAFSEQGEGNAELRLGLLFCLVGVGCITGPLLSDCFTVSMKSIQLGAILSLGVSTFGCLGMGLFSPFIATCLFSLVRSAGSSAAWTNSSILLQSICAPETLGRVLALDYALALLTESSTAFLAGVLQDTCNLSAEQVSLVMASMGFALLVPWGIYHTNGGGAASPTLKIFPVNNESLATEDSPLLV